MGHWYMGQVRASRNHGNCENRASRKSELWLLPQVIKRDAMKLSWIITCEMNMRFFFTPFVSTMDIFAVIIFDQRLNLRWSAINWISICDECIVRIDPFWVEDFQFVAILVFSRCFKSRYFDKLAVLMEGRKYLFYIEKTRPWNINFWLMPAIS